MNKKGKDAIVSMNKKKWGLPVVNNTIKQNKSEQEFNPDHNPNLNREPLVESCQKNCKYFKYNVDYYQLVDFDNLINKNSCGLKTQTQCGLSNNILQELK